ncbi:MAG: membrane protein insertion efficiency factor YidD [Candidatus Falkowbacteria bacterium]|nr:membrane protein insertion efficiency factor YidD [Candidatus Falkowbacteria bacterium]
MNNLRYLLALPKVVTLKLLLLYQKTFSLDHGTLKRLFPYGYCRFYPSCSEYAYQAIDRHGLRKGGIMALWRLLRCNPWNKGGNDPVL